MRRLSSLGLVIATSTDSFQRVLLTRAIHSWRNRAIELTKQDRERRLLTLGVVIAVSTGSWEGLMRARALRIWRDRAVELNRQDEERKLEKLSIFVATLGNSLESAMRTRAFRAWRECAVEMSRQDRERRLFTLGTVIAASTRSTEKLRLSRAVRTWRDRAVELERQRRQRRLAILGTAIAACTGSLEDYQLSLALSTWRHVAEEDKLDRERRLSSLGTAIAASTGSLEHNLRMWALRIWRDAVEWGKQERERRLAMLGTAIALATGSVEDLLRSRALCTWRDAVERSKVDRERRLSSLGTAIASSTSSIERLMLASALRTWRERASLMRKIAAMSLSRVRRTKASALKAWRLETARIRTARLGLAISSRTCKFEGLRVAHAFNLWRDCVDVFVDALEFEEPMSPDRFLVVIARGSEVGPQEKVVDVDDDSTQSPISPHRTAVVIARGTDVLTDAEVETSVVSPVYREMSQRDAECFTPTTISTTWLSRPPSQDVLEAHLQCEERVTAEDRLNLAGSILSLRHLRPAMRQWRDYAAAVEDLRSARVGALRSTVAPISNAFEQRHALEQWRRLVSSPMEIGEPQFSVRSDATVSAPRSASSPERVELNSEPSTPPGGLASSIIDLPRSASRADLSRRKERSMHRVPEGDVKDATRRAADGIRSYYSAESFFRKKAVDDDDDNNSYTEIEARDESLDDPDPQWVSMLEKIQALQRGVAARSSAKMVRAPFDDHDRVKNGVKLPVSWLAAPSLGSL